MIHALGVLAAPTYKSTLERDYAVALEAARRSGAVAWYAYEPWKFEVGTGAWFTPDWIVLVATGHIEVHETKGYMREAARVRLLAAVKQYPMLRWRLVKRDGNSLAFRIEEATA